MSIPNLICPVRSRFDLLERMLNSLDYPIDQIVIVDNSVSGYEVPFETAGPVRYIRPITGLGWGGGINEGITELPKETYWMWSSNDLVWGPGDLEHIDKTMQENIHLPTFMSWGFIYGAVSRGCVASIGLIDEFNFPSIYEDDVDWYRRCRLGGVNIIEYRGNIQHGADGHAASLTILSDGEHKSSNDKTHPANAIRYAEKWGGSKGQETFDTPFNSGMPLWVVKPDIDRIAAFRW